MADQPTVSVRIYRRLVRLYPREFRERVGESMIQTFNDMRRERSPSGGLNSIGFFISTFAETALSIVEQHYCEKENRSMMKNFFAYLAVPAIVGAVLVFPLVILEYVNTNGFSTPGFPAALFGTLWLLPFIFTILLTRTIREVRSGEGVAAHPISLGIRSVFIIAIAVFWLGLLNDQLPCFMGVPNCD